MKERDYKDDFYAKYFSSHLAHRKGATSRETLKDEARIWQEHYGKLLPVQKNVKIVDVGCGDASLVWWMQSIGYGNAEGIEISAELVELAKSLGINNIRQADLRKYLKSKQGGYDVIIFRDVLEHFKKEQVIGILKLCFSSLSDSGRVILQVPNAESPFFGRIRYGDFTHEIAFSTASIFQVLNMTGFLNIQVYPSGGPIVTGVKSFARFVLWKFVEAFYKLLLFAELGRGKRIVTHDIIAVAGKKP